MTSDDTPAGRRRGSIRQRGGSLQVRVFAGQDPVTGRDRYLSATIKGTDTGSTELWAVPTDRQTADTPAAHAKGSTLIDILGSR